MVRDMVCQIRASVRHQQLRAAEPTPFIPDQAAVSRWRAILIIDSLSELHTGKAACFFKPLLDRSRVRDSQHPILPRAYTRALRPAGSTCSLGLLLLELRVVGAGEDSSCTGERCHVTTGTPAADAIAAQVTLRPVGMRGDHRRRNRPLGRGRWVDHSSERGLHQSRLVAERYLARREGHGHRHQRHQRNGHRHGHGARWRCAGWRGDERARRKQSSGGRWNRAGGWHGRRWAAGRSGPSDVEHRSQQGRGVRRRHDAWSGRRGRVGPHVELHE